MARIKLRKGEVERRVKTSIERAGGVFISINWKKRTVHFLSPNKERLVDSLNFTMV
jgi:hypothetical protein